MSHPGFLWNELVWALTPSFRRRPESRMVASVTCHFRQESWIPAFAGKTELASELFSLGISGMTHVRQMREFYIVSLTVDHVGSRLNGQPWVTG